MAHTDPQIARRFTVSGRVQGVWFRDSTRREARRLQITGYAANLPDGNVLVHANGSAEALQQLETWLHAGPPMARVDAVRSEDADVSDARGFEIG